MSLNWGGGLPMDGGSLTGQITWATGLGAITHILGPTDQTLTIQSGTGRGISIGLAGQTISSNSNITWPTGLGAITHIEGPTDQNLVIEAGVGRSMHLKSENGTTMLIVGIGNDGTQINDNQTFELGTGRDFVADWSTAQATANAPVFGWGAGSAAQGYPFIFTSLANKNKDHDHAAGSNPTIFVHSATDPDSANTQYVGISHNATDGVIETGAGDIVLTPASGLVSFSGTTSSFPALRRTSATLEAVLADVSAYATFQALSLRMENTGSLYWAAGDTSLTRSAAGVVKVSNSSASTGYGQLRAEWPRREFGVAKTPGTAATVTAYGGAPTHTLSGTASNVSDSTGHYVQLSVDTATGGINIETTEVTKTENGPIITFTIKTGAVLPIATERLWVGLGSASLAAADSPSGIHVAAFRYAPTTDTTAFWRFVTNDGGADTGTSTTSTVAIAVSTRYRLTIDATNSASITAYVDGALIATHATNVPTATQALGTACHVTDVAGDSTKELLISSIHYETN